MNRSTLFTIVLFFFSLSATAAVTPLTEDELEYELLDINIGQSFSVLESAELYRYENEFLVPFELIIQLLELNLSIDPNSHQIRGVLNDEQIDTNLNFDYQQSYFVSQIDSITYISVTALEEVLGVTIQIEFSKLVLTINSPYQFPIQIRLERESREVVELNKRTENDFSNVMADQYRLYTPPKGYVNLRYAANNNTSSNVANAQLYGDLLYHQVNFNVNKPANSETQVSGVFAKSQLMPTEKLYGVFNNYAFGDVSSVNNQLDVSYSGLGAVFSSYDNKYDNYYGKVTIREVGSAGWQVELYRNGYLIQIGEVAENGEIIFDDIDVDYGVNRFELKFYGEYGEQETKEKEIIVGQNSLRPGEFTFNGGIVDSSKSLFNKNNLFSDVSSLASFVQSRVGISSETSLGLSYFYEKAPDEEFRINEFQTDRQEVVVSLNQLLDNAFLDTSLYYKEDEQYKVRALLLGSLGKFTRYNLNVTSDTNYDLETPETQQNYESLNYQANISTRFGKTLISLSNRRTDTDFGTYKFTSDLVGLGTSFRLSRFTLTNNMVYTSSLNGAAGNVRNTNVVNNLALTTSLSNAVSIRLSTDFDLYNDGEAQAEFRSINGSANWRLSENVSLSNFVSYDRNDNYQVQGNASWRHKNFNFIAGAQVLNDDKWSINLGVSFSLDYDYHNDRINMTGQYGHRSATLDFFNYIDNNKNDRYDEFDEPLPNVRFGNNKAWKDIRSDQQGFAYITGVQSGRPTKVFFDAYDTKASNLQSNYKQATYFSHAGGIVTHKIPFNYYVEIDGIIVDETELSTAKLVPVELYDYEGQLVKRAVTDIDESYYYFGSIEAGKYTVKVPDAYLSDKNLISVPAEVEVVLNGGTEFFEMPNIRLISADQPVITNSEQQPLARNIELDSRQFFTVQFGAYNDKEYCALRVEQLKAAGIEQAFYSMSTNSCKVMAGEFGTDAEAELFRKKLPSNLLLDGFTTVFQLGEDLFTIQIAAFSIQLSALTNVNGCNTELFDNFEQLKEQFYVLESGRYCKLYIGDFVSRNNAVEELNKLPEAIRQGAFIVKR